MNVNRHRAAAETGEGLGLDDLHFDVNGIADKDRLDELPLVDLAEGRHRALEHARPQGQAGGDGQAQQAVRDALAEGRGLAVFGVGVDLVEIARQTGKGHDVAFGDRTAGRDHFLASLELFKVQAVWGRERGHRRSY